MVLWLPTPGTSTWNIPALEKLASSKRQTRDFVDEYAMKDGRKIYLLGARPVLSIWRLLEEAIQLP